MGMWLGGPSDKGLQGIWRKENGVANDLRPPPEYASALTLPGRVEEHLAADPV